MPSPRQSVIDIHADGHQPLPQTPGERRASHDRRASDRRNNVFPLENREVRLRFAAQAAGFGTYDLDCSTGDSVWSPELKAMAGLPLEDKTPLSTEQVDSLIHPDDRPRFRDTLRASLAPEGSGEFEAEHRLLRPDGTFCWIRTKGRTLFAGQGESRRPLAATGIVMDVTASRAAAQALAERREELDRMMDAALDAIVTIDADQRIRRFNPAAARMFGCPAEEAMGSRLERFMPERYRESHARRVRRFTEGEMPAQALGAPKLFTGLRANGEEFPFEATITKVTTDGTTRITTFIRDISERVRSEEALRRSKEDLELAVRGANIGIWRLDVGNREVQWSERNYQLFGIPVGEALTYERIMAAVHPDDRESMETAARHAQERGEEYNDEYRVVWPDGSTHWLGSVGRFLYGRDHSTVGMRGVTFDITRRKTAEEALRRSKEDLELAVQAANIGIWHWDLKNGEVAWSKRTYELFGLSPGEPMNIDRVMAALHPEDRPRIQATVEHALAIRQKRPDAYNLDCRVIWPDGSIHWISAIGRDLYEHASGQAVGMRGIALDITERKRHEEALQHSKDYLESRVAERTAELQRAIEALERSNLELQQFAFIAAHDLQTPLRSISGFAQLLQKDYQGHFDPQADLWLQQLVRSARRMHELIRDLLSYSRVESRGAAFQPVDCNRIFDEVVDILHAPIQESGARVTRDELPRVMGDRSQLAQVLQNLIDNGLKYHGGQPPRIHVSARRQEDEWIFSVHDQGIGIAGKHLESIFDIFRRLHTQEEYPGTGIGLAVCRRVIHRHGGRIWVESEPGQGSTFHFTLPVRKA